MLAAHLVEISQQKVDFELVEEGEPEAQYSVKEGEVPHLMEKGEAVHHLREIIIIIIIIIINDTFI